MHIGIDASRLAVQARTGTEHYTFELLNALVHLDRSTTYTLYCNTLPATLPLLGRNFSLCPLPFPRLWTHVRLSSHMLHFAPDVLFVPSHVIPLIHPPRSVVTIHDLGYLVFPDTHTALRRIDLHLSTRWSVRAASRVIAISAATRDALVAAYGVDVAKITVIHHGVSLRFRPQADTAAVHAVRARYGIPGAYVLYTGTVQPRKNLVRLIDAFARVVAPLSAYQGVPDDLTLVIAGKKGWLTETIVQRVHQRGVAERVRFTGYVQDADMPVLLGGALAFVFPSLYEGFGMPVLEAMASGTPVLTSTTTSLPEVAGDAALLVNPHDTQAIADGIARLVGDAALRDTFRTRGLERAALFTWERCAQQTLATLLNWSMV